MGVSHSRWRRSDEADNLNPYLQPGGELSQLYDSLKNQTCKDFEWVIVDDGSKDNTHEVVKAWLSDSDFPIRYFFKENGGKHTALNYAVKIIQNSGMKLEEVDVEKAIEANHQLRHPSIAPETRGSFFENLDKGFYKAVLKCAPKVYYKQKLKECLIKLKIIRGGGKPNRV